MAHRERSLCAASLVRTNIPGLRSELDRPAFRRPFAALQPGQQTAGLPDFHEPGRRRREGEFLAARLEAAAVPVDLHRRPVPKPARRATAYGGQAHVPGVSVEDAPEIRGQYAFDAGRLQRGRGLFARTADAEKLVAPDDIARAQFAGQAREAVLEHMVSQFGDVGVHMFVLAGNDVVGRNLAVDDDNSMHGSASLDQLRSEWWGISPVRAACAATRGDDRKISAPALPMRPRKFRFMVESTRSPDAGMLPCVPRQEPQPGGVTIAPARVSVSIYPSDIASRNTALDPGVTSMCTVGCTWRPSRTRAVSAMSSRRLLVQEPTKT